MSNKQPQLAESYTNGLAPTGSNPFGAGNNFNGAATFRTRALNVGALNFIGYQVRSAGTATGSWSVQYSNDFVDGVDDPTSDAKWDTYTLTTTPPNAAGAAQTFGIVLDDYEYKFVRIKFTS